MASSIDTSKPTTGSATTASVRDNFTAAKSEIEALQTDKADLASPSLTGTATAVNLTVSGALTANGTFTSQGIDDNANATAITIDASENVGIGESNPQSELHISATSPAVRMEDDDAPTLDVYDITLSNGVVTHSVDPTGVATASSVWRVVMDGAEAVRIDASGRLIIANIPTTNPGGSGVVWSDGGTLKIT